MPDQIADALREEISRGEPPPGGALRQEAIAARFGVSRLPVRDALRRLESEGIVQVHANRGAFVTSLKRQEVEELFDLRRLLEVDLLRRSVPRLDASAMHEIEGAMLVAEHGVDGPRWSEFDDAFHAALYAPAARPRTASMVAGLRTLLRRYRAGHAALPRRSERWLADHRALVAACRAGLTDEACSRLDDHLAAAAQVVAEAVDSR